MGQRPRAAMLLIMIAVLGAADARRIQPNSVEQREQADLVSASAALAGLLNAVDPESAFNVGGPMARQQRMHARTRLPNMAAVGAEPKVKVGDKIPDVSLDSGFPPEKVSLREFTKGKRVVLVGLPGAFTPTWSSQQVPGYLANEAKLKAKGVSDVITYCVNDGAVMKAWAADQKVGDSMIKMFGDPRSELTEALGLVLDHPGPMSVLGSPRCKRFSMYIDDGVIKTINVAEAEDDPAGDDNPTSTFVEKMLEDIPDPVGGVGEPAVKVGDMIPDVSLDSGFPPEKVNLREFTKGKRVVLVGLPGAFTPTWSSQQVPGYLANEAKLKAKGVSDVITYCVNDGAVMKAWAADQKVGESIIQMFGDPRSELTEALGLVLDAPGPMSVLGNPRCKRFSMYIEDGVIKTINVAATEDDPAGDDNPTATLVEKMLEDIPEPAGGPIAIEVETILSPELQAEIDAEDVVMFSLNGCPFCKKAEEALADANIKFKRVEIGPFKAALKDKTGKTSAPSTWVKGTYVGGCNDGVESWHGVIPMLASGKMAEMLK